MNTPLVSCVRSAYHNSRTRVVRPGILVKSTVGAYGVWNHWAMTVDMSSAGAITHYINGSVSTLPLDSAAFCGNQGGALVLGQDQDSHLGQFDPNQVCVCVWAHARVGGEGGRMCVCVCVCVCVCARARARSWHPLFKTNHSPKPL
jgi:hypothetical protein